MLTVGVPKVLSAKELKAVSKIQEAIQAALNSDKLELAPWSGMKDKVNPQSGEVIGKSETRNCNVIFYTSDEKGVVSNPENAQLFKQATECVDFLTSSGLYLRTDFYGKELIAIAPKSQERKIIRDGVATTITQHYLVYTEENAKVAGPVSSENVKTKFFSIFNDNPKMDVTAADTKHEVAKKGFADMIED